MRASGEGSGEGAGGDVGEVSLQHDGVADLRDLGRGGDADGFLDEGLLDPDAHVAEHELEQVFGFDRRGPAEEGLDRAGADGGGTGGAHLGKGLGDVAQGDLGGVFGFGGEQVVGGCAEVAVAAVGGGEFSVGRGGDGKDGAGEEGSAGVELAGIGLGEGQAGEILGEEAGVLGVWGFAVRLGDGLGDGGAFFEAAAFGGELIGQDRDRVKERHRAVFPLERLRERAGRE